MNQAGIDYYKNLINQLGEKILKVTLTAQTCWDILCVH